MAVNSQHAQYAHSLSDWKVCRDVLAGKRAVHLSGEAYLPKLGGQTLDDYKAYQLRAGFFAASRRTHDGLTGMLFRKDVEVNQTAALEPLTEDVTNSGVSIETFAELFCGELMAVGRVAVLVDYPDVGVEPANLAEQKRIGLRPYASLYKAETLINWRTTVQGGRSQLSLAVLEETQLVQEDEFTSKPKKYWRVLDLVDGAYRQRLFTNGDKGEFEQVGGDKFPMIKGVRMPSIPLVVCGVTGEVADVEPPPMLDLCEANLEHYRLMADYRHGLHFTSLPTAVVTGHQIETDEHGKAKESLSIGSTTAWVFPDSTAGAFFLEFSGAGLGAQDSAINRQEQNMALLGARIIAGDTAGVEATETAQIKRAGEVSVLTSIAFSASRGLTRVLQILADWVGIESSEVSVKLNTDYMSAKMNPQMLTALTAAWQSGAISWNTVFHNLSQGELIEHGVTAEDEQSRLQPILTQPANGVVASGKP